MCDNADRVVEKQIKPGRLPAVPAVVFYHRDLDGLVSGWAVWSSVAPSARGFVLCHGVQYGEPPPTPAEVEGLLAIVVDFSWDFGVLEGLRESAAGLLVIDHHKTKGFLSEYPWAVWNVEHAGCRLAWDHFHPGEPVPPVVAFTEDRDLWRWALPGTREFCAEAENRDWSFENIDEVAAQPFEDVIRAGRAVVKYQDRFAERVASKAVPTVFAGHSARVIDIGVSSGLVSEIGQAMQDMWQDAEMFVLLRWQGGDKWIVSLRSPEKGADCAELAQRFCGGGHYHAAGFVCDWSMVFALTNGSLTAI